MSSSACMLSLLAHSALSLSLLLLILFLFLFLSLSLFTSNPSNPSNPSNLSYLESLLTLSYLSYLSNLSKLSNLSNPSKMSNSTTLGPQEDSTATTRGMIASVPPNQKRKSNFALSLRTTLTYFTTPGTSLLIYFFSSSCLSSSHLFLFICFKGASTSHQRWCIRVGTATTTAITNDLLASDLAYEVSLLVIHLILSILMLSSLFSLPPSLTFEVICLSSLLLYSILYLFF